MNMAKWGWIATGALVLAAFGCSSSAPVIPTTTSIEIDDALTLVWNGKGIAYAWKDGKWDRSETFDYAFDVVQKRYGSIWKSVKNQHRLHPEYKGAAGPRDQVMYFEIEFQEKNAALVSSIRSNLGPGKGTTDVEFRAQAFELDLNGMDLAPYNRIRFEQKYLYERGQLLETVELVKSTENGVVPFMKMEEVANIFVRSTGLPPPSIWSKSVTK